ncbi:metal-dependent hydrolase [Pseudorhodobacter sp. E13]|uniref:metal-dependent hydrolase n=1 Tax=Pseudorhodobacter sp. E13 TaxID=2487931 RepID=UPI000F8CCE7A|nr:metal-dependent hydrolase [Pseudorhodobacter sp. E13]RUS60399.1 metal-dependent hydrolase [Pseudorhodobacter sp. E13]
MILAHLPSGYLLGKGLARARPAAAWVLPATMLGAVLPDFDLFWFYLIDDRAFHHHRYWVHIPAFWAAVAAITLPLVAFLTPRALIAVLGFFAGLMLHLLLDTFAGDILLAWPWSDRFFHLITVPAAQSHWLLNFILHPVFLLELAIIAAALWTFVQARTKAQKA